MSKVFTVITVCFNSEKTIEDTLKSVHQQNFENYEHLIIDGKSTDKTLDIIKRYQQTSKKIKLISERDRGLYDAMNKGLANAKGMYLTFLNSDDLFASSDILQNVHDQLTGSNIDMLLTDIVITKEDNIRKVKRKWKANIGNFKTGWLPAHPGMFIKRDICENVTYDLSFRIASDSDWILRLIRNKPHIEVLNKYSVLMRGGGESSDIFSNYREMKAVYRKNEVCLPWLISCFKVIRKLRQLLWRIDL